MPIPVQITFRDIDPSPAIEERIHDHAAKLEAFADRITGFRVVVETQNRRHHKGNLFHVTVDVSVPGNSIVVSRDPKQAHQHEDLYVALRDAFDATRRRIREHFAA
jgi:ribosomal subunit interface protein